MRDDVRAALAIDSASPASQRTVDITTTGRRSGQPRRIETWFYRFDGEIYLSGLPFPRRRDWLTNLVAEPRFTFHLKNGPVADLAATATEITDPAERRRILVTFADEANARREPGRPQPASDPDRWVELSPLVKVTFTDA